MKIRSVIILISVAIYILLAAMLFPFFYLNSTINEINYELRHVEQEHIAVKNLVIAVSRELNEVSDFVFFDDNELPAAIAEGNASFLKLRKFAFISHEYDREDGLENVEADEVQLYKNLKKVYQEIATSRAKVLSFHLEGKTEEAIAEMENVFEEKYEYEFLPLTEAWMEAERMELEELEDELQRFSSAYLLNIKIAAVSTLVILLFLFYLLNRLVTRRLQVLVSATKEVARGDLHSKVEVAGKDEIATLSRSFNEMTSKLASSQARLLEQCYLAGLNEASGNVLHNVRSSFTGLILGFEQIAALLDDTVGSDDPHEGLEALRAMVAKMEQKIVDTTSILVNRDGMVVGDESMQRYFLRDLVSDSRNLLFPEHLEKVKFYVDPGLGNIGKFLTHRIIFIQILSNLFTNACESILGRAVDNGLVRISAFVEDEEDLKVIHIYISDNGEGIVADDIERVFERNFSKKHKLGLTGLGLHWCSDAVASLNGRLYAESEGKDKGATFHLVLPNEMIGQWND
jgi:signal transduction histidine kinase